MDQDVEANQYRVLAAGDIEVCMGVIDPGTSFAAQYMQGSRRTIS